MEWAPPAAAAESADADSYFGLNDPETSVDLLRALREAGADEAVHALAARAANAGEFSLFAQAYRDAATNFPFGREPDGAPSKPWNWQEPARPGRTPPG